MEFNYHDKATGRYGMLGNMHYICNTDKGILYTNTYGLYRLNNSGELWLLNDFGNEKKFCFIPNEAEKILELYKEATVYNPNYFCLSCKLDRIPNMSTRDFDIMLKSWN